ncbi:MAG: Type 1 glutamine amidotransferase-like domain-containing protein [Anaerolineae bacterium]|nr:Type 1 glutamine amidotransferase-like domain-containing protein [Anaerolineae bacterium]
MPQSSIFSWQDGAGWLVLSGGGNFKNNETLDIDSAVLSRTVSNSPLAYIWAAGDADTADLYLDYLDELGGRTGYLIDIASESEKSVYEQLKDAGIIVIGDGQDVQQLHNHLHSGLLKAMTEAYENGATIYGQGQGAAFLAAWMNTGRTGLQPGLGWLANSIIVPYYTPEQQPQVKTWLHDVLPTAYALGLGKGAALALSPDGQVEVWGNQNITVLLGQPSE